MTCPIAYKPCGKKLYSEEGLKLLARNLDNLKPLDYTAGQQRQEAMERATKMSIQGVQPKLSAVLNIKDERFEIVDKNGKYILKPQHHLFPELPQNEDLTMRLAKIIGINVPLHGLVYSKDDTLTYFIKRFDRHGHNTRIPVEDFAQLSGLSRDTKYNYSMEKLVKLIDNYFTFPAIEKVKLFKLVLFNYLVGNEDMHLKNYSVIRNGDMVELSPAYDLLNTTIVLKGDIEEIALPIGGKKKNLTFNNLVNYFGKQQCQLPDKIVDRTIEGIKNAIPDWMQMIEISFLSNEMKEKYTDLLNSRLKKLQLSTK
jgi:serine/threonine-protein kinase HipA